MVAAVLRTASLVIRVSRSPLAGAGAGGTLRAPAEFPAASTRRTKPLPSSSSATLAPTAGRATPSANLDTLNHVSPPSSWKPWPLTRLTVPLTRSTYDLLRRVVAGREQAGRHPAEGCGLAGGGTVRREAETPAGGPHAGHGRPVPAGGAAAVRRRAGAGVGVVLDRDAVGAVDVGGRADRVDGVAAGARRQVVDQGRAPPRPLEGPRDHLRRALGHLVCSPLSNLR